MAAPMSITRRTFAAGAVAGQLSPIVGQASTTSTEELARFHYGEFARAMGQLSAGAEGWYLTGAGSESGFVMRSHVRRLVRGFGHEMVERQSDLLTVNGR